MGYISRQILQKYLADQHLMELNHATHLLNSIQDSMQIADFDFSQDLSQLKIFATDKEDHCLQILVATGSVKSDVFG